MIIIAGPLGSVIGALAYRILLFNVCCKKKYTSNRITKILIRKLFIKIYVFLDNFESLVT